MVKGRFYVINTNNISRKDRLLETSFMNASIEFPWIKYFTGGNNLFLDYLSVLDRSITEIEIRHAALNDPNSLTAKRALFFLKKVTGVDNSKLSELRKEILDTGLNVKSYGDPSEVAENVLLDLQKMIEEDFPMKYVTLTEETVDCRIFNFNSRTNQSDDKLVRQQPIGHDNGGLLQQAGRGELSKVSILMFGREVPSALEQERMSHQGFQDLRTRVYIGRPEYFSAITDHVNSTLSTPIVIVGESGSGKVDCYSMLTKHV